MPGAKKAQRTKGNVKPSSSSQAALLLAASGQVPTGFIGFSSQPAFVPASEMFDDADSAMDDDFRLVLRKLSKRDSVTKIKALQELVTLCSSKDEASVKVALPFWPRVYSKTAIDVDHKVRELSQKALASLASRAGKALAPHLRSIMGVWMVSMCDTYPTVASAANTAFFSTFSTAKQTEAVRFCKAEITECLMNFILQQTARTLSDPLTTSEEDMESKYQRVVSSSLQAFSKLLHMLRSDGVDDSILASLCKLLDSPTFWKHAKSTVPQIKCGVLSLMSATCQLYPDASRKVISKVAPFIFSLLDSTDASLASHTWEAVLSVISAHEECWQYVNWQKAVWPKIKQVLENGCFGQAAVVCPCLLPLLSKIPKINFTHFFDSFRLGLREDSVLNSPLELSALVRSFLECIQFSVKRVAEGGDSQSLEIRSLFLDQVLLVVQASLTDSKPGLTKTDLFPRLCPLLSVATKIDSSIERDFWSELSSFTRARLLAEFVSAEQNIQESGKSICEPAIFQRLKLLVEGIVYQQAASAGKIERVRFALEESHPRHRNNFGRQKQIISDVAESFIGDAIVAIFKLASMKKHTLPLFFSLFKDLCVIHIPNKTAERLNNKNDCIAEIIVSDLGTNEAIDFNNVNMDTFHQFVQSNFSSTSADKESKFRDFACDNLVKVLLYSQTEPEKSSVDWQFSDHVIISLFAFLAYVDAEDGAKILSEVLHNLTQPLVTCQFIEHLLDHVKFLPACRPLVAGTELAGKIEQLTVSVMSGDQISGDAENTPDISNAVWRMLTSVVSSLDESDNHLFSQSCLDAVVTSCWSTLQQLLPVNASWRVDTVSSVVELVLSLLDKQKISTHLKLGELVLSLLRLLLAAALTEEESNHKLLGQVKSAWLAGLRIILQKKSDAEIQQFICQFCSVVKQFILAHVNSHNRLLSVGQVLRASLRMIASPAADDETEKDDSEFSSQQQTTEEDNIDVETLSAALDQLLLLEAIELDYLKEVCEYLYIDESLDSLSQPLYPSAKEGLSLQTCLVKLLHNMYVLQLSTELIQRRVPDVEVHQGSPNSTSPQLQAVAQLCHGLLVLKTAAKMKLQELKEFPKTVFEDTESNLWNCLRGLNTEQVLRLVDLVVQRNDPVFTLAIKQALEKALKSQLDEGKKASSALSAALLSVRMSFLHRCLLSDMAVSEVHELLGGSTSEQPKGSVYELQGGFTSVSGHAVCEAFTLASTIIFSCENFSMQCLADCVSGFLQLAEDCNVLDEEAKVTLFHQMTEVVKQLKEKDILLMSASVQTEVSVEHYHLNISIIRSLKQLMVPGSDQYWEVTLCALVEWIQYLSEVKQIQMSDVATKALLVSTCQLAYLATQTFNTAPVATETAPGSPSSSVTEKAKTEWNEFFSEGVFSLLLPLFVSLASSHPEQNKHLWTVVLQPLAASASVCPSRLVLTHRLPARLTTTDKSGLPDNLKTLLNHLCPLLVSTQRCVEVAAYKLLSSVMEDIPKYEICAEDEDKQEEELRSPPEALIELAEAAGHFLECLKLVQVEDHIEMDPGTSEYAQTMGYLLAWRLLLQLFRGSPNQLRAKYAQYFKSKDSVSHLLDRLFRLMPQHPSPSMLEFTSELHVLPAGGSDTNLEELSSLALYIYRQCLEVLPALVRTWWVDQDRRSSHFVDRFTMQYLSSSLIWQQITSAQNTNNIDGITIRARPAAREVSATYEMAEVTVNMCITLPENYPLGKLEVACDKRVGVPQGQWDRWLLQLNIFLQHQNGSIVDGLRLWKGNIDKKFEGVEDCMVCFSVIHGTTFQLPRLTCKTCRKKFHSACLYKWFNTAQKSSCPLCRNLF